MPCERLRVERADALLDPERPEEGLLHRDLLVEREADEQGERIGRDQRVGLVVLREIEVVGAAMGSILARARRGNLPLWTP